VPFVLGSVSRLVDDPHTATVAVTVVCGTLLLVPLALLGRRVAEPGAGIATAWVAALAPGLATTPAARGAGSEAEYALLAAASTLAFYGAGGWWHPNDHTDQRRAGEWISAHTDGGDRVMTRSLIVDYSADRPTLAIPYAELDRILAFGRHYGARYLVVDAYTVDELRPQLASPASDDRPAGLELVHEVTAEGRTTRIFALVPPPAGPATEEPAPSLGFMGDNLG
jgi:hypothetical protein